MRMTAAEAARHFRAVLSRVAAGEEIQVVRDGAPIAVISPPPRPLFTGQLFDEPVASTPNADASFAEDLHALRAELEAPQDLWRS
jgi:antitoxin (DNA-binding transcriptional repressor) of toxin-antitoxin stability system